MHLVLRVLPANEPFMSNCTNFLCYKYNNKYNNDHIFYCAYINVLYNWPRTSQPTRIMEEMRDWSSNKWTLSFRFLYLLEQSIHGLI